MRKVLDNEFILEIKQTLVLQKRISAVDQDEAMRKGNRIVAQGGYEDCRLLEADVKVLPVPKGAAGKIINLCEYK